MNQANLLFLSLEKIIDSMDFYVFRFYGFLCISFSFRRTMKGIGDDDGKIGTLQLMPDQDLLTIFWNIFCFHGCLNQNKTRFRSEPFKRELKKLFLKEKNFNIRCSGNLNESMYVPKYTEEMKIKSPDLDIMFIADTMCISDERSDDIPAEKTCVGTLVNTDLPAYFRISVCPDQRSFYSDELIFKSTKFVSSKHCQ